MIVCVQVRDDLISVVELVLAMMTVHIVNRRLLHKRYTLCKEREKSETLIGEDIKWTKHNMCIVHASDTTNKSPQHKVGRSPSCA